MTATCVMQHVALYTEGKWADFFFKLEFALIFFDCVEYVLQHPKKKNTQVMKTQETKWLPQRAWGWCQRRGGQGLLGWWIQPQPSWRNACCCPRWEGGRERRTQSPPLALWGSQYSAPGSNRNPVREETIRRYKRKVLRMVDYNFK